MLLWFCGFGFVSLVFVPSAFSRDQRYLMTYISRALDPGPSRRAV